MTQMILTLVLVCLAVAVFLAGRRKAVSLTGGRTSVLHSRPVYHGFYVALACGLPAMSLWFLVLLAGDWMIDRTVVAALPGELQEASGPVLQRFLNDAETLAGGGVPTIGITPELEAAAASFGHLTLLKHWIGFGAALGLGLIAAGLAMRRIDISRRTRQPVERVLLVVLLALAAISVLTTAGIVFSVLFEAIRFFDKVPFLDFLFGVKWSPQIALREDQVGSSGAFGAVPLFTGTLLITLIAMLVAGPVGLLSAVYLTEYADPRLRAAAKPILEILAGIPTVVYGFFAALIVAPALREAGAGIGLDVASESALAAGLVMGMMIIPFVSSLTDDALAAVPADLRDASLGLGATQQETVTRVIIPAALPGIVAGFLLAVSRAIGETMIVVMAAGLAANLTANPFEAVTTVTVQIVTLLVGDQEFDSAKTLAAFALGLTLFLVTLGLNVVALRMVQKYQEQYD
ncbi:MAG: phosphate ABC transporter permease subunit PstC [bacterium]|nr:phosphate ABC transporter permease subunit PstC [bacterium]MDE0238640.1 phosphate ABC transporter permease subunit PstC [bacterium]